MHTKNDKSDLLEDDFENTTTSHQIENDRTLSIDSDDSYDSDSSHYTQYAFSNDRLLRTNSQSLDDDGNPTAMKPSLKNYVSGTYDKDKMVDAMKIAVFSQEGNGTFSTRFHQLARHSNNTWSVDEDEKDDLYNNLPLAKKNKLLSNINMTGKKYNTQPEVLNALLEDKDIPTVIAVIEGARSDLNPVVKINTTNNREHTYLLADTDITGQNDNQTMNFYVRENMKTGVEIKAVEIEAKNKFDKDSSFEVGQVSFSTGKVEKLKQYSILVTHIPNEFVGNEEFDTRTHQAIMDYAEAQEDRTVVAYTGDTNYTTKMGPFTLIAAGGNAGQEYLTPPNSTQTGKFINKSTKPIVDKTGKPKGRSVFMQTVPLIDADESFCVSQPSMLNLVRPNYANSSTDTDHPSMMTYIPLNAKLNQIAYANACTMSTPKHKVGDSSVNKKRSHEEMDSKEQVASDEDEIESIGHTKKSVQKDSFQEAKRAKSQPFKDQLKDIINKSESSNIDEETIVDDTTKTSVLD